MSDRVYVGTRKGLFELRRKGRTWDIADVQFLGDPVTAVADFEGSTLVGLDLGHFGPKLWKRDITGTWREIPAPAFPPKPETAANDPQQWTLDKIWGFEPGGVPGRIWAGSMPGGLFRSDDSGETWALVESFWRMPERETWGSVAGGGLPGLSTVSVDPRNPAEIRVGVSTGGVWGSSDTGKTWQLINRGLYAEYMPPEQRDEPIAQDVHQLARCHGHPDVMWCQHHNGVFRSEDGGANWRELAAIRPSKFGFAVAAHPKDGATAWFVPAVKDEKRIPVDGKLVVARTRDAGRSFDVLSRGLPRRHAYDLVYRHALAVDETGDRLAFGSTTGGFWISEDGGDSWAAPDMRLPPVNVVAFAS